MPQPGAEVLIAGPLQDVSIAYRNRLYVADRVFPLIDNAPPEAKIARYLKGAWFRDEAQMRGPSSEAARGGYPVDYLDVILKEYAFAREVTDEDRQVAAARNAPPLQPDQDAVEFATDRILLKREVRLGAMIKAASWSGVGAGGTDADGKWAAGSGNTFLANVKAQKAAIQNATGMIPNALLMDNGTYMSLTEETTVLDKIKYTQLGVLTSQLLAAILDLDEVIVAGAVTSGERDQGRDRVHGRQGLGGERGEGDGVPLLPAAQPGPQDAIRGIYRPRGTPERGASDHVERNFEAPGRL
jgi:hypothetical protein